MVLKAVYDKLISEVTNIETKIITTTILLFVNQNIIVINKI